jgi:hypothetical protein
LPQQVNHLEISYIKLGKNRKKVPSKFDKFSKAHLRGKDYKGASFLFYGHGVKAIYHFLLFSI